MHAQVVAAVAAFEPVTLVADPAHADDARRRVTAENVEVLSCRSTTRGCATPAR